MPFPLDFLRKQQLSLSSTCHMSLQYFKQLYRHNIPEHFGVTIPFRVSLYGNYYGIVALLHSQ